MKKKGSKGERSGEKKSGKTKGVVCFIPRKQPVEYKSERRRPGGRGILSKQERD